MAHWLDETFYAFDRKIFSWMHALQQKAGGFMNGFCKFISFFGEAGWAFIVLALVFLLFRRTRRMGVGMGFALVLGAIVTNILLKNIVDRARPFTRSEEFSVWWHAAGQNTEDSASFPSGHTTAAFAAMVALFLTGDKRYSWTGLIFACMMAFSRVYLIVHYPTDVLAGVVVGTLAGVGGMLLCKLVYKKAGGKCKAALENGSIVSVCRKLFGKKTESAQNTNTSVVTQNAPPDDERTDESTPPQE